MQPEPAQDESPPTGLKPGYSAKICERPASLPLSRLYPSQILVLAVWFGVLAGFCEVAVTGFRFYFQGKIVVDWPELLWMTPAADVLLLAAVGVLLAIGARLRAGIGSLRLVAFVYLTVSIACTLFRITQLSGWAKIILALG